MSTIKTNTLDTVSGSTITINKEMQFVNGISGSGSVPCISKFISGLTLSNGASPNIDIDIAAGSASDSTLSKILTTAGMTKQIDTSWVAGTNEGGLFFGAVAASTWYHTFLIRKDSDGSVDAGFDTSLTAANKPAGYTYYRRIGSVLTDASAYPIGFIQVGNRFRFKTPILDVDVSNLATAASTNYTLSVPLGIKVAAILNLYVFKASTVVGVYISSPDTTDLVPDPAVSPLMTLRSIDGTSATIARTECITNTSSQIRARSTAVSTVFRVATLGWDDVTL